ncbi:hypothetical protein VPH35_025009 [Triticum aestivum]
MSTPTPALLTDEGMARVRRKKDFRHMERVDGRMLNVLQGLELHANVFSPDEQFGCCYNYAADRDGNPPGIVRDEAVDPLPPLLAAMARRLVLWRVLPPSCVPDSCIVNVYDVDDCIPPHVDHHDFLRPFCTASFLTEAPILFGKDMRVVAPGEFSAAASIPLPVGSVLVLAGNGADVAKHCVPAVPAKRISITFRKMDASKVPFGFRPDPLLQSLAAAVVRPAMTAASAPPNRAAWEQSNGEAAKHAAPQQQHQPAAPLYKAAAAVRAGQTQSPGGGVSFSLSTDEFPALGASPASGRRPGRR